MRESRGLNPQTFARFHSILASPTRNRLVAVTKKNRSCLVPIVAKIGDKIAIILRGNLSCILRPEGHHFILISEAYVHGIMHGAEVEISDFKSNIRDTEII